MVFPAYPKIIIETKAAWALCVALSALSACGGASSDGDAGPGPAAADAGPVAPGGLAIQFSHEIQGEPLALNSAATLADGSPVTFSTFRYWFSNLVLVGAAGVEDYVVPDAYFLIEQTNQSRCGSTSTTSLPGATKGSASAWASTRRATTASTPSRANSTPAWA